MSYKILLVDDEPANLRSLARLFREDYEVLSAESGDEALALLSQHDVALLITDQRMPGMTGIELLQKTVPLRPRMVRIILTGYTDVDALVEAINCGQVYRYVTKPWNNEELRLTVKRALEHFETNKSRQQFGSANARLVSRIREIQQLATLDDDGSPNLPSDSLRHAATFPNHFEEASPTAGVPTPDFVHDVLRTTAGSAIS